MTEPTVAGTIRPRRKDLGITPTVPISVEALRQLHAIADSIHKNYYAGGYAVTIRRLLPPVPWEPDPDALAALFAAGASSTRVGAGQILRRLHEQGWDLVRREPTP